MRPSLDVPFSIRAGNRAISPNETPGFASPAHAGFAASSALSLLPIDGTPRTLRRLQTSWTLRRAVLNFVPASAEAPSEAAGLLLAEGGASFRRRMRRPGFRRARMRSRRPAGERGHVA